jgi:hypothetical protein
MQNLVEHVKLLHTCVSLGKSLQRKEIWLFGQIQQLHCITLML